MEDQAKEQIASSKGNLVAEARMMLQIAKDEIQTIQDYLGLLEEAHSDNDRVYEIIADEFNHALIAIYSAVGYMGIRVPEDGITEAMEGADFE